MSSEKIIEQDGFKFAWKSANVKSTTLSSGFFAMRDWQTQAFDLLKDASFMILNAPMGSGKSWLMCLLSAFKMKKESSLRCIIAVPQTIIAPGFVEAKLQMPDGEKLHWEARHNLCDDESNAKTVNYLLKWLERPCDSFSDRILICTHATLVAAYKKLKTQGRLSLLQNLLLWIDEAHHVKNTSMEDFEGASNSNSIGELVGFLLCQAESSIQLGLTTASFFRGDRHSLLTEEMEAKFERFNLPYDEYLESMEYLESFSFDFLLCGHDYTKAVEILIKKRKSKDIIYVPHPRSRHSTGDKYREVENIIVKYQDVYGGEVLDMDNGLTVLQSINGDFKILDLVDEDRRDEKKAYINSSLIKHKREALDVIISLGMFKEGANWIWADRSIIAGARSSLVDIIQMIGRLFRDAKDKKHVEVIQLLPFSLDQQEDDVFKANLNNYLKAIYASLILEDILNPVRIKMPTEKEKVVGGDNKNKKSENLLAKLIPDEAKQLSLIEEVSNQLMDIIDNNKEAGKSVPVLWDEYQKIIPDILGEYNIENDAEIEDISKLIWGKFARRTLGMQGISVENIDFNILQNTHPLEGLLRYTSGACDIDTFKKLRDVIRANSEEASARWNFHFDLLSKFIAKEGHSHVHSNYYLDDHNLGSWVSVQRKEYKNNQLLDERKARLEAISDWTWDKLGSDWQKGFALIKSHFERTSDSSIPEGLVVDGINLFYWATVQRKAFKKGKMSQERQFKLESLPLWYWDYSNSRETEGRDAIKSFVSREKHARVPTTHEEGGFPLGLWIKQKRDSYQKAELPREEIEFFESVVQWSWKDIHEQTWQIGYSVLQKFVKIHGHAQPPSGCKLDGLGLATWVKTQRTAYFEGRLSEEKVEMLSILPGWSWRVFEDRNKQGFEALDSFVKREGHALVTVEHSENGFKLGRWVAIKRQAHQNPNSKNAITEEDRQKLESYPWWFWNGDEGRWERGKHFLLKFCTREGHSRVKRSYVEDGFELGNWIGIWRYQYKKKTLPQWKIDFFEALPLWSWDVKADQWFEGFNILKQYVQREGHASVPANYLEGDFALGTWVRTQIYSYAKQLYGKKLSQEKIKLLESFPDWSWNRLKDSWDQGYEYLEKFAKINGHGKVPARYVMDEYRLGTWVSGQRYSFKNDKLSSERIALLEKVPGWVWGKESS